MASVSGPLLELLAWLVLLAAVYGLALLALDRLLELLHRRQAMQQFQDLARAAVSILRLVVAYSEVRHHLRKIRRSR